MNPVGRDTTGLLFRAADTDRRPRAAHEHLEAPCPNP